MAKRSFKRLGERELQILNTVWELNEASVADVHTLLLKREEIAYTTVMTTMKKLADKGYLSFFEQEKRYVYRAKISPKDVRKGLLADLISAAFRGSPLSLVQTLVDDKAISEEELKDIKRIIDGLD